MNQIFGHRLAAAVVLICLGAQHQGLLPEPLGKWVALVAGVLGTIFVNVRGAAPGSKK